MTNAEMIAILQGMPQHVEVIVQNINDGTTHRVQGIHVKITEGVVAINVVNRVYAPRLGDPELPVGVEAAVAKRQALKNR